MKVMLRCPNKHSWEYEVPQTDDVVSCPQCGKHPIAINDVELPKGQEARTLKSPKKMVPDPPTTPVVERKTAKNNKPKP
jgi:hypothetical protein